MPLDAPGAARVANAVAAPYTTGVASALVSDGNHDENDVFSARSHGLRDALRDLEIEINNRLLRDRAAVSCLAAAVARAVEEVLVTPCA